MLTSNQTIAMGVLLYGAPKVGSWLCKDRVGENNNNPIFQGVKNVEGRLRTICGQRNWNIFVKVHMDNLWISVIALSILRSQAPLPLEPERQMEIVGAYLLGLTLFPVVIYESRSFLSKYVPIVANAFSDFIKPRDLHFRN